ncbi:MAG: nitrite reductase small subunit NirD [Streptosporangiales bacterium]|nr:nitrite reductase small subunit NirD [Streptosporangiales bacterium]
MRTDAILPADPRVSRVTGRVHTGSIATGDWLDVCHHAELEPERGACALVRGQQVALFRTHDGTVHALSNYDPFSGAYVLSRGIVGTRGDTPTVASPMYKQVFDLRTGRCLDDPEVTVPAYPVRVRDGRVEVALP